MRHEAWAVAALLDVVAAWPSWPVSDAKAPGPGGCSCNMDAWAEPPAESALWEYEGGCDFDVLNEPPSQEEFDKKYFGKAPVLIRNYTTRWLADHRWEKGTIYQRLTQHNGSGDRVVGFHTDDFWASFYAQNRSWDENQSLSGFLCHDVCKKTFGTSGHDQKYVFDRDEIFQSIPWLAEDYTHADFLVPHFDPDWHERWSRYLLVSGLGSGINFHHHTDAYNGCVRGRKRWFLYPPGHEPPEHQIGPLAWWRTVYDPEWSVHAAKAKGRKPNTKLLQCMQETGDLMYVPLFWWHATISLGEGIGVSGQFVRSAFQILANATKYTEQGRWSDAERLYVLAWKHRAELEMHVQTSLVLNIAVCQFHTGKFDKAERTAKRFLKVQKDDPRNPASRRQRQTATTIIEQVHEQRKKSKSMFVGGGADEL